MEGEKESSTTAGEKSEDVSGSSQEGDDASEKVEETSTSSSENKKEKNEEKEPNIDETDEAKAVNPADQNTSLAEKETINLETEITEINQAKKEDKKAKECVKDTIETDKSVEGIDDTGKCDKETTDIENVGESEKEIMECNVSENLSEEIEKSEEQETNKSEDENKLIDECEKTIAETSVLPEKEADRLEESKRVGDSEKESTPETNESRIESKRTEEQEKESMEVDEPDEEKETDECKKTAKNVDPEKGEKEVIDIDESVEVSEKEKSEDTASSEIEIIDANNEDNGTKTTDNSEKFIKPKDKSKEANKSDENIIEIDVSYDEMKEIDQSEDDIMEIDKLEEAKEPDKDIIEIDKSLEQSKQVKKSAGTEKISESTEDKEKSKDNTSDVVKAAESVVESAEANITSSKTVQIIEESEASKSSNDDKENDSVMEVDLEKESSEKPSSSETENTEFVQISQDKQDDSQLESQPMETEDPFGGDSLSAETIDISEEAENRNRNFSNLEGQADNLDDVFKSHEKGCEESENQQQSDDQQKETSKINEPENTSEDSKGENESNDDSNKKTTESSEPVVKTPLISMINIIQPDKINEKNIDELKSLSEKNKSKSDADEILPGQDDELCIIPDDDVTKSILEKESKTDDNSSTVVTTSTESSTTATTKISTGTAATGTGVTVTDSSKLTAPKEATSNENDNKELNDSSNVADNALVIDEHKIDIGNDESVKISSTSAEKENNTGENVIDVEEDCKNPEIQEIPVKQICKQCNQEKICKILVKIGSDSYQVCSKECQTTFLTTNNRAVDIPSEGANSKHEKRCSECLLIVETHDEKNLSWETMEFCNEDCLGKFQTKYGSYCRNCNGSVQPISLGKYCVRFGYDVRQFCCSTCLEEFKKGLKVCTYCQKDISSGGSDSFLAPVGDKGQFKDFCTQFCMEKYSKINSTDPPVVENKACNVCQEEKPVFCEIQLDRTPFATCSDVCFAAFKYVHKIEPELCSTCKKYFDIGKKKNSVVFHNKEAHKFCSKTCLNIFIITHRKIVPCNWCKVKKYNFDMIKKELKNGQVIMMCSLNCLTLYQVSMNAVSSKKINCDFCKEFSQAQYHLTMSDATIRNFCCYDCVMKFQAQYTKSPITIPTGEDAASASTPVPTGTPKRNYPTKIIAHSGAIKSVDLAGLKNLTNIQGKKTVPVISSVTSLASNGQTGIMSQKPTSTVTVNVQNPSTFTNASTGSQIIYKQQIITRPTSPVKISNKMTQCKPIMHSKGISVKTHSSTKSTQTEKVEKVFIPIPVPIYVPFPVQMWSLPYPVPVPFPLPIPVPIFIPTTRNSTKGIIKEFKRIQDKVPADPFEAELLMMAEMVATDKKVVETDSDSSDENDDHNTETIDTETNSEAIGDDVLSMALKMTSGEIEEAAVDLEAALTPSTIATPQTLSQSDPNNESDVPLSERTFKGKKRSVATKKGRPPKKGRKSSISSDTPLPPTAASPVESQTVQSQAIEPIEKPDANMALKYTFGVNAWRKWVMVKNTELEKQSTPTKKAKLFKTDLLQLTADELNYSLCLFVKEVRKPNGSEYAPDTIYYLCLGIQQYLFENNRIDNIFTDTYYEQFTDCLDEIAKKFSVLYNDADFIVTRVEEEHLWECKQLGAHSPHVLLTTLMFFNTKHFNLVSVEEHMQLSFSHIMKHWKRNPGSQPAANAGAVTAPNVKSPGSRNVLLRFYPPQSALEGNSKKKKVYEQQENEENPLRCPVKLYEFYLSKCPESVKSRNDVFYLLPERSCVPDSPVWYSTSALAKDNLEKMLHRVKMVKEINVALLNT